MNRGKSTLNNKAYQQKAHKLIPGGAHTYSRGDDQFPSNAPPVLERGEGCYVWDIDGNKYLDYGMGLRSVTLGYGYERVAKAAIAQIYKGNNLPRASKIEVEAAEKMVGIIDGMDMVKFAKNGSTVTSAATKLARAYTGRKYIARCLDHPFFSYDDWFIGDTVVDRGVPEEISALTVNFRFNDIASLQSLFDKYPRQIACVILEPSTHIEPVDGFLTKVKQICEKEGAVFILDEMITGFKWHIGGAQKYYGVIPDLCTFGKGMANGFSVAAVLGKRDIMELGGIDHDGERVFLVSTTHGAEMCGMGALSETIDVYKETDVTGHLWDYGKKLCAGINEISKDLGIIDYFYMEGAAVSPAIIAKDKDGNGSLEFKTLFAQEMCKNGVLMSYVALCLAHTRTELDMTLEAVRKSLAVYKNALDGNIGGFLEGNAVKPVFRKYN